MAQKLDAHLRPEPLRIDGGAVTFFANKLRYETDSYDVYAGMKDGAGPFTLLDVRSEDEYDKKHIRGAYCMPHRSITKAALSDYPPETVFVVYCWGPGCNGSTKAALKLAQLGYAVKEMIGGIEYWECEGYPVVSSH